MTEEPHPDLQSQLIAGQALYTWSTETIEGESGDGFVAISPYLESKFSLLKNLPAAITQFAGGSLISREQRLTYEPVGRYVAGSEAVLYRKIDAGDDAHSRPGRYIVHLIVGQREYLPLSSLYEIYSTYWIKPFPVNHKPSLSDIPIESPRNYESRHLDPQQVTTVAAAVHQLVRHGSVELGDPSGDEILAILACVPTWVDSNAILTPVWSGSGPTATLAAHDNPSVVKEGDYRATFDVPQLLTLRAGYADIQRIGHAPLPQDQQSKSRKAAARKAKRRRPRKSRVEDTAVISTLTNEEFAGSLTTAVERWQRGGSKKLSVLDKQAIDQSPAEVLGIMRQSHTRLPDKLVRGQVDALAIAVLKACGDAQYWPSIYDCLPEDRDVVSRYVKAAPEPSVLLASFYINLFEDRRFEIILDRVLPDETVAQTLAVARADGDLTRGLCESIRLSSYSKGCLLRGLLSGGAAGYEWLFSNVLPGALDAEDLVPIAAQYPELFVRWLGVSESNYRSGLVELFGQHARDYSHRGFRRWDTLMGGH